MQWGQFYVNIFKKINFQPSPNSHVYLNHYIVFYTNKAHSLKAHFNILSRNYYKFKCCTWVISIISCINL